MGESSSSVRALTRQEESEGENSDSRKGNFDDYQIQIVYTLQKDRVLNFREYSSFFQNPDGPDADREAHKKLWK